jgi:hypothetical protein
MILGTAFLLLGLPGSVPGALTLQISYTDSGRHWAGYYAAISTQLKAAAQDWGQYFTDSASLEVEVVFVGERDFRTWGASVVSTPVKLADGSTVFEQAVATELRTGVDANGSAPDLRLEIGSNYLANVLWFDPNPSTREAKVPGDRVDAMSVMLHEFGHALGFNGWMNPHTGACAVGQVSTFDRWVKFDGSNFFFHGPKAMENFGGPVPITFGNAFHVGNEAPRPGAELASDMMNGLAHVSGERYYISRLDLGMLADAGLPMRIPQPALTRARLNEGRVQFQVSGPRARWYRVEVSTNLVHWAWVMDYVSTQTAMTIVPEDALGQAQRYYRAQIF